MVIFILCIWANLHLFSANEAIYMNSDKHSMKVTSEKPVKLEDEKPCSKKYWIEDIVFHSAVHEEPENFNAIIIKLLNCYKQKRGSIDYDDYAFLFRILDYYLNYYKDLNNNLKEEIKEIILEINQNSCIEFCHHESEGCKNLCNKKPKRRVKTFSCDCKNLASICECN